MSPSDLLRETGLKVSTRQFRRYLAGGLISGVRRGKRGRYIVVGPVTPKRIAGIKKRIAHFKCRPGRKRLKCVPIVRQKFDGVENVRFPRFNLHISMEEF